MNATATRPPRARRRGFTLVELLVVIAIAAILAGIGMYAFGSFRDNSAVNNGAVLLQSWLQTARQRAIRDQAPRGLRLLPGTDLLRPLAEYEQVAGGG